MAYVKPIVYDVLTTLLYDRLQFFSENRNQDSFEGIFNILQKIEKNLHSIKHLAIDVIGYG